MLAAVRALVEQRPVKEDYSKFEYVLQILIFSQPSSVINHDEPWAPVV